VSFQKNLKKDPEYQEAHPESKCEKGSSQKKNLILLSLLPATTTFFPLSRKEKRS
jgi:hypothetical protein